MPILVYAQRADETTTVIMFKGSQNPSNEQFYDPAEVTVSPGSFVTWKNEDSAIHTATSGDPETATPDDLLDTVLVSLGASSKPITMPSDTGEYPYFCTLHPWMTGTVAVQ